MKKIILITIITLIQIFYAPIYAQNAGYFAGGFADGFNKGMSSSTNSAAISQAIIQQRIENRRQFGTQEILRMNALEKDADNRLREIFTELSTTRPQ